VSFTIFKYKDLESTETQIVGKWLERDGKLVADENLERIDYLINSRLQHIADHESGWSSLYFDSNGKNYWEKSYPQSELHGGGPTTLTKLDNNKAKTVYKINAEDNTS